MSDKLTKWEQRQLDREAKIDRRLKDMEPMVNAILGIAKEPAVPDKPTAQSGPILAEKDQPSEMRSKQPKPKMSAAEFTVTERDADGRIKTVVGKSKMSAAEFTVTERDAQGRIKTVIGKPQP